MATDDELLACEQALHLGLTQDLFWARFIWVSREIWARAARGLGRGRGKETEEFSFLLRLGEAKSHWLKMTCINQFRGECRNVLNRVPGGRNVSK